MMVDDLLYKSSYMFIRVSSKFYFLYMWLIFYTLIDLGFCSVCVLRM
jgi:hypothetical protein